MNSKCMLLKTVVPVFFGCARVSHCGSYCGPPTAFPCGHQCTVGVLAGTHQCAWMPRVASRQSANIFCGCWSLVLSMSLVCVSKHVQLDFFASSLLLLPSSLPGICPCAATISLWILCAKVSIPFAPKATRRQVAATRPPSSHHLFAKHYCSIFLLPPSNSKALPPFLHPASSSYRFCSIAKGHAPPFA